MTDAENPYVGPEPFRRFQADLFFGRRREAIRLRSLVESSSVVLFYSPSGAGKTSLVHARLIPELEQDDYTVRHCRVGGENAYPRAEGNGYVLTALSYLAEDDASIHRTVKMGNISLVQHLGADRENPTLVIVDQFEEIFTTRSRRPDDREDFFLQLREALAANPQLVVLLVMREDHLASLERYAPLLPDRLRTRFRMDRLTYEQAVEAIRRPAEQARRPFAEGIAEELANALRRERRDPGAAEEGAAAFSHGEFIEPVQLQVVCYQLWESLRPGSEITAEDRARFGPLEAALGTFYDRVVARVAAETQVPEREIRAWFSERLITADRYRNLVKQSRETSGNLANAAVDALVRAHLVRVEPRLASKWYELVHDSFVEPILDSNKRYFAAVESLLTAARGWREAGRPASFLPTGAALLRQRQCARENPRLVGSTEREYLRAARRRRTQRRLLQGGLAAVVALVLGLTLLAYIKTREAERQQRKDRSIALALSAETTLKLDPRDALRRAIVAADLADADPEARVAALGALRKATREPLAVLNHLWDLGETAQVIQTMALDDDGDRLAILDLNGVVTLGQLGSKTALLRHTLEPSYNSPLALSPDGETVAVAPEGGSPQLLRPGLGAPIPLCAIAADTVLALAFNADGTLLALGTDGARVLLCDPGSGRIVQQILLSVPSPVADLTFAASSAELFIGHEEGILTRWRLDPQAERSRIEAWIRGHIGPVEALTWSMDGSVLVSAGNDGVAKFWSIRPGAEGLPMPRPLLRGVLTGDIGASTRDGLTIVGIEDLAFLTGGELAFGSRRGEILLWDPATNSLSRLLCPTQEARVFFSGDGKRVAILGGGSLRIWSLLLQQGGGEEDLEQQSTLAQQRLARSATPVGYCAATASGR